MFIGYPISAMICAASVLAVNLLTKNPYLVNASLLVTGSSVILVAVNDLRIGLEIKKAIKQKESNYSIIDEKQEEYDRLVLIKEDMLKNEKTYSENNKKDYVNNNHQVNSITNSRNKARTLELTKRNSRRYN